MNKILLKRIFAIILFLVIGPIFIYGGLTYIIELFISLSQRTDPININRFSPSAIAPGIFFLSIAALGCYNLIHQDKPLTDKQGYFLNVILISLAILTLLPMVIFPTGMGIYLKKQNYVLCNERTDITRLRQQTFIYAPTEKICEKADF